MSEFKDTINVSERRETISAIFSFQEVISEPEKTCSVCVLNPFNNKMVVSQRLKLH